MQPRLYRHGNHAARKRGTADEPAIEASILTLKNMIKPFSKVDLEASFARVHQHARNRNIGMIFLRDDLTSEENGQRHASLKSEVRKAGYGFIEGRHVDEKSLLVVGKKGDDGGALLGHLKHLGEKYGQGSILHKPHNSEKASLHSTNETEKDKHVEVDSWHPNRTGEFHSLMKSRKPTTVGEPFHFINTKSFFSRMGKIVLGAFAILEEHPRTLKRRKYESSWDLMTSWKA